MSIERIEINNFLVFKDKFSAEFCPGINIVMGENGSGKTTLLEVLDRKTNSDLLYVLQDENKNKTGKSLNYFRGSLDVGVQFVASPQITDTNVRIKGDFIKNKRKTVFITTNTLGWTRDIIDKITNKEPISKYEALTRIIEDRLGIRDIIREETFGAIVTYVVKSNGEKYMLAFEASGIQKFILLYLLLKFGFFENGSIMFWDEPENSLNPELVPLLTDILLQLSCNGVQIFIATHDYNLARYFDIRKDKNAQVMYHNLIKLSSGQIICESSPEYLKLPNNLLEKASADLFEAVVSDAMWVKSDE